jgi:serine phosphatase RsbU (regulator of sigma subunit)
MPDAAYGPLSLDLNPGDVVLDFADGVTHALSSRGKPYHSALTALLRSALSPAGDRPGGVGREIIGDIQAVSEGRLQFEHITLGCFGPMPGSRPVNRR